MKKVVVVKTDDPQKKKFNIVVTGPVEKIVEISPKSVYLEGSPGQTLSSVISISPVEKYKFSLLSVGKKQGSSMQANLIKPEGDSLTWQVKVSATADTVSNLYDVLQIQTDSKYKPVITVRVYATFNETQKKVLPVQKNYDPMKNNYRPEKNR